MINDDKLNENPIRDFLFQLMILDYDITHDEMKDTIYNTIIYILQEMNVKSIEYLDYKIKKIKNEHIKVVANNIITALWFSGIFPLDPDKIYKKNEMIYNDKQIKFNNKTKKLLWKKIKE